MILGAKYKIQIGYSSCSPKRHIVLLVSNDAVRGAFYELRHTAPPPEALVELLRQVPLTRRTEVRRMLSERFGVDERDLVIPP